MDAGYEFWLGLIGSIPAILGVLSLFRTRIKEKTKSIFWISVSVLLFLSRTTGASRKISRNFST